MVPSGHQVTTGDITSCEIELESLEAETESAGTIHFLADVRKTSHRNTEILFLFIGLRILQPAEEISFFWRFLKK